MRHLYTAGLITFSVLIGTTASSTNGKAKSRQGFFVSIDGLQPEHLQHAVDSGWLTAPKGLGWLYRNSAVSLDADPAFTTLTAASHVSTITCSSPAVHGITSNSMMRGGEKMSGFTAPILAETLWQAAKRQGRTVTSIAYVGADGQSPERTADVGIAYPDAKFIAPGREVVVGISGESPLQQIIDVVLNPTTKESAKIFVTITEGTDGKIAHFDNDDNLTNGTAGGFDVTKSDFAALNIYFQESDPTSAQFGFKRRVIISKILAESKGLTVYVSGASYNNAYPKAFREALEAEDLVWPDYDVRIKARSLNYSETVVAASNADVFSMRAAALAIQKFPTDVLLYYQPLLDSFGHKYQRELVDAFANNRNSEVLAAYRQAFLLIDSNLSQLLQLVDRPTVALMGDHGMEEIQQTINLGAIEGVNAQLPVVASGALALLYPNDPAAPMVSGEAIADALDAQVIAGKLQMSAIYRRDQAELSPGGVWPFGDAVWAFLAGSGYSITFNPINKQLLLPPPITGNHGHDLSLRSMRTALLIHDERIRPQQLGHQSLLDAVPTFGRLMGFAPPANCQGRPISLKANSRFLSKDW